MNRFEIYHNDDKKALAFGNDKFCGEFLQIWDTSKSRGVNDENILVNEDKFTNFTRSKMLVLLLKYGFFLKELEKIKINNWEYEREKVESYGEDDVESLFKDLYSIE